MKSDCINLVRRDYFTAEQLLNCYSIWIQQQLMCLQPRLPVLDILPNNQEVGFDEAFDDLAVPLLTGGQLPRDRYGLSGEERGQATPTSTLGGRRTDGLTTSSRLMAPLRGLPGPEPGASSPFLSIPLQVPVPSCSPWSPAAGA